MSLDGCMIAIAYVVKAIGPSFREQYGVKW
jgi:hypothetical protein